MQIRACLLSGQIFPHTLLCGLGGCGKTEVARCIGYELGYFFVETHAAAYKDREALFTALVQHSRSARDKQKPLMFFLDEIHRLKVILQEAFYPVLKEYWLPTSAGKVQIAPFTLIGATTRLDMLEANSFLTRLENIWEFTRYPDEDIAIIVAQVLSKERMQFSAEVTESIAKRSLGVPRIGVNLARKVRTTTLAGGRTEITMEDVRRTFALEEIDELGLRPIHHQYLSILASSQSSGHSAPMGVGAIAAKMRHSKDVVEGSIEPLLLELDFVACGSRGRILTRKGLEFFAGIKKRS